MSLTLTSSLPVLTEFYFIAGFLHSAKAQKGKKKRVDDIKFPIQSNGCCGLELHRVTGAISGVIYS